jgi:hypothetical protein
VAGCCECGDEPSGSCATELVKDMERKKEERKQLKYKNKEEMATKLEENYIKKHE